MLPNTVSTMTSACRFVRLATSATAGARRPAAPRRLIAEDAPLHDLRRRRGQQRTDAAGPWYNRSTA